MRLYSEPFPAIEACVALLTWKQRRTYSARASTQTWCERCNKGIWKKHLVTINLLKLIWITMSLGPKLEKTKVQSKKFEEHRRQESYHCHVLGLTLILDAHTNLLAPGTVSDDIEGFFAVVDERNKYPLTESSQLLPAGHVTYVAISATRYFNSTEHFVF